MSKKREIERFKAVKVNWVFSCILLFFLNIDTTITSYLYFRTVCNKWLRFKLNPGLNDSFIDPDKIMIIMMINLAEADINNNNDFLPKIWNNLFVKKI